MIHLIVERLIILRHPNSSSLEIRVSMGKNVQLICKATGLPPPSYAWYHCDSLLNHEGAQELNLEITNEDQGGEYRCLVTQIGIDGTILEKLMSQPVYVTVNPTPVVIECQPLPFVEIKKGESLILSCKAKSHPEPTYQWFRDNTALELHTSSGLKV